MELKKAVGILRKNTNYTKCPSPKGICISCPLEVAETLLAALDPKNERPGLWDYPPSAERPPEGTPIEPRTLAGRDVHGWGWKVFWKRDETLSSESEGKGSYTGQIPQGTWLNYLDWASLPHCSYNKVAMEPYPPSWFSHFSVGGRR